MATILGNGEVCDLNQGFVLSLICVKMQRMMVVPELLDDDIPRQSRDRRHLGKIPRLKTLLS
jgi:hypothetical protein